MESLADYPLTLIGRTSRTRYTFPARAVGLVDSRDVTVLIQESKGNFRMVP